MTLLRTPAPLLALGALFLAGTAAGADDTYSVAGPRMIDAASRCASYGPGFVDLGNGTCARVASHVRVDLGLRPAAANAWAHSGTSSAELRSEGGEFVPGVGTSHQLRVRSGLQTFNPF